MSIGGGGETRVEEEPVAPTISRPDFYNMPREWVTPPTEYSKQAINDIGEETGWGFGNKNMFGSGVMADALARRLGEAAIRSTRREDKGQWITPNTAAPAMQQTVTTTPSWGLGFGGWGGK